MNNLKRALFALIAVCLTVGYIWEENRTVSPPQETWDDARADAVSGGYRLISTDDVWRRYEANPEGLLLVDTRQEWEYRSGHIKGAINFPMEPTWLSRWRKKGDLESVLGPDRNRLIVFY